MFDPRFEKLAETLVSHSTKLQPGDNVLIEAGDVPPEMAIALVRAAQKAGANPVVNIRQAPVTRALFKDMTEETVKLNAAVALHQMQQMQSYIGVRGGHNSAELSDVPGDKMKLYTRHWLHPVHLEHRVKKTRWCILRFPNPAMAQEAQMSTEAFEEFFFNVCTMDYAKMEKPASRSRSAWKPPTACTSGARAPTCASRSRTSASSPASARTTSPTASASPHRSKTRSTAPSPSTAPTIEHGVTHENVKLTLKTAR
jgi:aminopeptidase